MTDRPLIFSPEMIRALGDGRKTQTRRLLRPQPPEGHQLVGIYAPGLTAVFNPAGRDNRFDADQDVSVRLPSIGDRIWVKEGHALVPRLAYRHSIGTGTIQQREHPTDGYSAALFRECFDRSNGGLRWRSPIFMPKWASRFTLVVTDVRIQRVQDITEADARAEGVGQRDDFRDLWNRIHGPGAWDRNDWGAALTFDVHKRNILEMDG